MRAPRHTAKAVAVLAALGAVLLAALFLRPESDDDQPPDATYRLVFAAFGPLADRIYVAAPDALDERQLVANVPHTRGWAITPAPSMAGDLTAFTVLPPEALPRRDSLAELWVLNVRSGELTRLAGDADLLAAPVFDADGLALLYRRTRIDGSQQLVRVEIATRSRRPLHEASTQFGLYPLALSADGEALYAELSTRGTDLYRVREGAEPEFIAHASDHIARDWRLSPDQASLAYLAPEVSAERVVHRAQVVDLTPGVEPRAASPAEAGAVLFEQFAPAWTPDGSGLTVGIEAFPAVSAAAVTLVIEAPADSDDLPEVLPPPEQGFDAPLGWSPNGQHLAARSFDGRDAAEPGRESFVVIAPGGERATVVSDTELIYLGWLRDE